MKFRCAATVKNWVVAGIFFCFASAGFAFSDEEAGKSNLSDPPAIQLAITISNISSEVFNGSSLFLYDGIINVTATGGTGPYQYSIIEGPFQQLWHQNNGYFPNLAPGNYPITVTDATGQTLDTIITVAYQYAQPVVTVSNITNVSSCGIADGSFVLTGSGGTPPYQYSIDGGNTFSATTTFTNLAGGLYPVLIKDANGQVAMVGVNPSSPNEAGLISLFNQSVGCANGGIFSNTACSNIANILLNEYSYTGLISFSLDGVNYKQLLPNTAYPNVYYYDTLGLGPGLYTIYIKDDGSGALTIATDVISKYCSVQISFLNVDASCHQNDGQIVVNAVSGVPPYSYTMDGVNYQSSNVFTGVAVGSYTVSVKDAQGALYSQQTTVYDKCPTVSATETDEHCASKDGTISAVGYKGTTPYQFSIDGVNFQPGNIFSNLSSGNYTVTIKDANGFTATTSITVDNNCIKIDLSIINETCGNANGRISVNATNGTAPYLYSIDGINFQSSNTFANLAAGNYTLTVKDQNGVSVIKDTTLTNAPAPQLTIATTPASCSNTNGVIGIATTGGLAPLQFSIDNGNTFQSQNLFNGLDSANYAVVVKDANGCTTVETVQLTALPTPKIFIGNDTVLCEGNNIILSAPQQPGYSYLWQDNSNEYTYNATTSGVYSVTVTNQYNCSATSSVVVRFRPLPQFDLGNDSTLCNGQTLLLQPQVSKNDTYLWSTGSTATTLKINAAGTYWLEVSDSGCVKKESIAVNFKPMPSLNLGNDTTLCEGQTILLDATNPSSMYIWQDGSTSASYLVNTAGTYSVKVSENGCDTSGRLKVNYITKPEIAWIRDTTLCITEQLILNAYYQQSTYEWQDGSTGSMFAISRAGAYNVAITNICGTTNDSVVVQYENCACKFFIPSAFTPNNDGKNDLFRPQYQCLYSNYEIKIFNRWGQLVFASSNPANGWDGSFKGELQPSGTYVWEIGYKDNLTGKYIRKNGTVVLIR